MSLSGSASVADTDTDAVFPFAGVAGASNGGRWYRPAMLPLLTRAEARAMDAEAIAKGVAGLVLMENAGLGAAEAILGRCAGHLQKVCCVGGVGQNGGDAWVVARQLFARGVPVDALLVGHRADVRGDARPNLDALVALGVPLHEVDTPEAGDLADASLIVDGLFGTGLDRPLEGRFAAWVRAMDAAPGLVVALDLPSGVDADTGAILGVAPHAALTVTFGAHKRGLWQYPGRARAGEVRLVSIGVPGPREGAARLVTDGDVAMLVPPRAADVHKGRSGHVLVVAGSPGKTGAALLSGLGALHGGAGLVTLASRAASALDGKVIELMTMPASGPAAVLAALESKASGVVGPGLGVDDEGAELALALAREAEVPLVLDADALTALAPKGGGALRDARGPRVLTPHPGEAARLLGVSVPAVQRDRFAAALGLAERSGHVTVLKGAGTVVAQPSGELRVIASGTPALGVAGTGDVLAGLIAALLGSGLGPFEAAFVGAHWHGRAGELAAGETDRGLRARDVARLLPSALARLRGRY